MVSVESETSSASSFSSKPGTSSSTTSSFSVSYMSAAGSGAGATPKSSSIRRMRRSRTSRSWKGAHLPIVAILPSFLTTMVARRGPAGIGVGTDLELRETAYITDDDGICSAGWLLRPFQLHPGSVELVCDAQMVELHHSGDRVRDPVNRDRVALCSNREGELLGEGVTDLLLAHAQRDLRLSGHRDPLLVMRPAHGAGPS